MQAFYRHPTITASPKNPMSQDETYDFIGKLAIALYSQDIRISLGSLRAVLADADRGNDYASGRGMAAGVSAAYDHWERKDDRVVAEAIAYTYTDKHGNLAWRRYKNDESVEE